MATFYRLTDRTGRVIGVLDSADEAKQLVPEVNRWEPVPDREGCFDGWRPDGSYYDWPHNPHFRIRAVEA